MRIVDNPNSISALQESISDSSLVPSSPFSTLTFLRNKGYYFAEDNESGTAMYLRSSVPVTIDGVTFQKNVLNSSLPKTKEEIAANPVEERFGGACIRMLHTQGNLSVDNGLFDDNHSLFFSNCLEIFGDHAAFTNSEFSNNYPLDEVNTELLDLEATGTGGVGWVNTVTLISKKNKWHDNRGYQGGAIYLSSNKFPGLASTMIDFVFEDDVFTDNSAYQGGAIFFQKSSNPNDCYFNTC